MTENTLNPELSFEDALKELEEIVRQLESGDVALDDSITLYERGNLLKQFCQKRLEEAKLKVEKITAVDENGQPTSEPFEEA